MKSLVLLVCTLLSGQLAIFAAPDANSPVPDFKRLANATPSEIKAYFKSADYKKLKRTDAEFLNDVFHGVLQRDPDPKGYEAWIRGLKAGAENPATRANVVDSFLKSPEYAGRHEAEIAAMKRKASRNPGNVIFDTLGMFVNDATALPADRFAPLLKKAGAVWLTLQIDNGGNIRTDNVAAIERGWAKAWRDAGFKVGFWGAPRGVKQHNSEASVKESTADVQADAALAVKLTVQCQGEFYIADCEDGYQGYAQNDPATLLNRVYVEAFMKAAKEAGIPNIPRALSSMGRVALDMKPWIDAGWDAMPQAYWNSYAVYQPSKCVDFYVNDGGWPIDRVHPTIATYSGEGENRKVSLQEYEADLKTRGTVGFSFYLPESYLGLTNHAGYEQLAKMSAPAKP